MKKIFFFVALFSFLCPFQHTSFSQSISGNMNAGMNLALGYGNVNIFRGDEKVASLLTDEFGNFNIELDTGLYRVELQYAGYEKMIREIHVTGDEKGDFALSESKGYLPVVKEETTRYIKRESEEYYLDRMDYSAPLTSSSSPIRGARSERITYSRGASGDEKIVDGNAMTAGELNDFSKWQLWKDITENELFSFKSYWRIFLSQRYSFQITNQDGFPIQGAFVELLDREKNVLYSALTDNTGKAELWGSMMLDSVFHEKVTANVNYLDKSYAINRPTAFENGINMLEIETVCGISDVVDIAFVVDATGSMGDEIEYLKKELNRIVFQSKNNLPELTFNFGSVFYRDHGDAYLTRTFDFTDVLSATVDFISNQVASGGGDFEEAVEVALEEAIDSLSWSENARTRILFLVLDAPPHNTRGTQEQLKSIMQKAANKGIRIVPLVASGINREGEYLLRTLALGTNGTYVFLTNDSGIGSNHLLPVTDEHKVELLNDILIRIIETYTYYPECNEEDNTEILDKFYEDNSDGKFEITLWPNPTSGKLNLQISEDIPEVFITDLTGKIIYRLEDLKKNRERMVDMTQFPRGMYLLSFKYEEEVYMRKFIKI